jgi:hypothetical protein
MGRISRQILGGSPDLLFIVRFPVVAALLDQMIYVLELRAKLIGQAGGLVDVADHMRCDQNN